jgi:hypothetical protein
VEVDSDVSASARYPVVVARAGEAGLVAVAPLGGPVFGAPAPPALAAAVHAYLWSEARGGSLSLAAATRVAGTWPAAARIARAAPEAVVLEPSAPRGVVRIAPPTPPYRWGLAARLYTAALIAAEALGVRVEVSGLCTSWDKYLLEARGVPAACLEFHPSQWRLAAAILAAASEWRGRPRAAEWALAHRLASLAAAKLAPEDARRAGHTIPLLQGLDPLTEPPGRPRLEGVEARARAAVAPAPHWAPRAQRRPEALIEAWRLCPDALAPPPSPRAVRVRGLLLSLLWRGYTPGQAEAVLGGLAGSEGLEGCLEALDALGAVEVAR